MSEYLKILIVSWAWPPIGRIGALRPLGMAREWAKSGHEVHVVTGPGDRGGEYSPDLEVEAQESGAFIYRADAPGVLRPKSLQPSHQKNMAELVTGRPVSRVRQILSQWKSFPDQQRSWIGPATALSRDICLRQGINVVWTTSPPESVHFVGSRLAAEGWPWVADFRDPWSDYQFARWDPLSRWAIDRIERRVLSRAGRVTANSEGIAQSIERTICRSVACIRNGFDLDLGAIAEQAFQPRTLGYFGRIDPQIQHPDHLWEPLRSLARRSTPWTVHFFTSPGGGGGAAIAVPVDLRDSVHVHTPLPHAQALNRMGEMEALLVLCYEGRVGAGLVPGKVYEYAGVGRPILVCAPTHYEVRRLVEQTGIGVGGWGDAELVEAIEKLNNHTGVYGDRATLSRRYTSDQMLKILLSVAV